MRSCLLQGVEGCLYTTACYSRSVCWCITKQAAVYRCANDKLPIWQALYTHYWHL